MRKTSRRNPSTLQRWVSGFRSCCSSLEILLARSAAFVFSLFFLTAISENFLGVDQESYGPVVDQSHVHHGFEPAGFHRYPFALDLTDQFLVELFGPARLRGPHERRTPSFPAISEQGELGNDQHRSSRLQNGSVHFTLCVLENPQVDELVGQVAGILFAVLLAHSQEDQEPLFNGG